MAELVNKDAVVRFLAGYEENLIGKRPIENGTVYFALKPDPSNSSNTVGSIYIDANGKRIIMSGDGVGVTDTQGDLILTKYIKSIEMDGSAGSKATLTYYKGDGSDVPVDMPSAGANTAGVVTTGAQTFAGAKTFSNAVTINGASNFNYAGIEAGTSAAARVVWFAHSNKKGTPVYHNSFTYNPGTETLNVANVNGLALKATGDGQGNNIYETYLKSLEGVESTTKFTINGIKGNDGTVSVDIPAATEEKAGLITTGSQSFKGKKTFLGFRYSGIASNTALTTDQPIWFMDHATTLGTPAYNADLTYNPSTKTLKATNFEGLSSKATADGNGLNIRENYLKDIENSNSDKHILTLVKGNDNTVNLTLDFVLKSGDTMTGELKTSFKDAVVGGSYASSKHTIPDLVEEVRYSSGVIGSFQLTTAYESPTTKETIPVGWYNFEYIPHRKGGTNGQASGDNCNYGTLLLYGMTVNQQHWRIRFASEQISEVRRVYNYGDIVTRATGDSAGNNILDKYISEIAISEHTGNSFKFKAYDGNGNDQNEIVLPIDTTGTLASLLVNGAQTLLGIKTFTDGLAITSKEFRYKGIESATANADRVVWFADSGEKGKPVYNTNFTYNPSTKTLRVENIVGTISNAIKDEQGNVIYTFYLKDITSETGTEVFKFWGLKGDNSDATIITIPKATSSVAGLMSTTAQTFAGIKTFKNNIVLKGDTAGYPQIQKEGSATSWIYGRDTAVVRITTHDTDAMYNAITSMKTLNGDWSNGVYTSDNMYWTYTPDAKYTAKDNSGYIQMILSKDGLLTVPSILAQTRMTVGGALNTQYTFYNHGTSYFADNVSMGAKLTVSGETSLSGIAIFRQDESVTSGTAAANRNSLVLYGDTYGNDAQYIKNAGRLSYGDPGPQIIFGTSGTLTSAQKLALIFTDHDTIGAGTSLSLVSDQTDAYFIAPSIKALTRLMIGNGLHNYFATVQGPNTANATFYFPNTGGTLVTHPTRGTAVGASDKPVFIASTGVATASTSNIGNNGQPIYMQAGQLKAVPIVGTAYGGTGNTGFTKGTMIYAEEDNLISSNTAITTNGNSELTITGSGTTGAFVKTINSSTNAVGIYSSTNRGLYDFKKSWWIIYTRASDDTTRVPKHLYLDDQLTVAKDITAQEDITVTKTDGLITTPNLFASNNISIGAQDLTKGFNNTKTTFLGDVLTVDADSNLKRLVITDETDVKHIEFKRGGWNYFAAPSSGCFAFLPNNATPGEDNSRLVIENGGIRPGKTNSYDLGTSAKYWRNAYIQTLAVSANAAIGGALGVTGKTTLSAALEVVGAAVLKNTLDVTGASTFNSTVLVKNELTSEGNIWVKNDNPYIGFMEGATAVGYIQADGDCLFVGSTANNSLKIDRTGNVTIPTGVLTLKGDMYEDAYNGALNMNNSDVYGLNSIYTADLADSSAEGIHFYRTATTVDTIWVANGTIYFTPNRTLGTAGTSYHVLHTGNYTNTLDNIYVLKSGDTMSGTLNALTSGTTNISMTVSNNNGKVGLHASTNQGLYDFTNGRWLIYNRDSDDTIRVPDRLYPDGGLTANNSIIMDTSSTGYGYYVRNSGFTAGRWYVSTKGTVGDGTNRTVGITLLTLGNSTAASTATDAGAGNARGLLRIYGPGTNYANLYYSGESANYTLYLPERTGQLVSSNIPATTSKIYVMGTTATGSTSNAVRVYANSSVYCSGSVLYGAAWNDYAEYRQTSGKIEAGRVVIETGRGDLKLSTERLQPGANVVSDTFGFAIGQTKKAKTPLAVAGRVLVYTFEDRYSYEPGDAVCTGPNGTVSKMTREEIWKYPERIVGTVSEIPEYDIWESGDGPLKVNGRIWIKVK